MRQLHLQESSSAFRQPWGAAIPVLPALLQFYSQEAAGCLGQLLWHMHKSAQIKSKIIYHDYSSAWGNNLMHLCRKEASQCMWASRRCPITGYRVRVRQWDSEIEAAVLKPLWWCPQAHTLRCLWFLQVIKAKSQHIMTCCGSSFCTYASMHMHQGKLHDRNLIETLLQELTRKHNVARWGDWRFILWENGGSDNACKYV